MTHPTVQLPYTLFKVNGADAERFLQGQISCDLAQLSEGEWSYGTANTPKGRIYWLFVIARIKGEFWIRVHNDIVQQGFDTLSKYKVFFKCEMQKLEDFEVIGELSENGPFISDTQTVETTEVGTLALSFKGNTQRREIWRPLSNDATDSALLPAWYEADCKAGIPEIYQSTIDTFILQQLNLHELGAVSFKKGCYTGQEIIARMKFLGKLKKQMYYFESDSPLALKAGQALYNTDGKKIGELVRSQQNDGGTSGLAVCSIADIEQEAIMTPENEAKLRMRVAPLHYNT